MEKFNIRNLIERSTAYRKSKVLETAESDGIVTFLVDGRENRQLQDSNVSSELKKETCPFCQEAIPCAHLGEIADWNITGNKYPGTDIEVVAMSKEHSSNLRNTDFRAWMYLAMATNAVLVYAPSRKSILTHKHVPLLDFKSSPLFTAKVKWLSDNIGYTAEYKHRAIVIKGGFEERLDRTISILRKLYEREQMYNIVITPDTTYIQPSKIIGQKLGSRIFVGIASVKAKNREFFEYTKKQPDQRDGSFTIPDFSSCEYEEQDLIDLLNNYPTQIPATHEIYSQFRTMGIKIDAVLSLGENNIISGYRSAKELNAEFQSCDFGFITDKKGNFVADCVLPVFKNFKNGNLLIVVNKLTKNIKHHLLKIKEHYGAAKVHVISNDGKNLNLWELDDEGSENSTTAPQARIETKPISTTKENDLLEKQIEDVKKICEQDSVFIEMIIVLNVQNVKDIDDLQREFVSATTKIISFRGDEDWGMVDHVVHNNIHPFLRKFNPITSRLLTHIAKNKQTPTTSEPKHKYEEGAIVLYVGDGDQTVKTEACKNLIDILAMGTGRRIYLASSNDFTNSVLEVGHDSSYFGFLSPKLDSRVIISENKVIKKMERKELETYMMLHRYIERLHNGKIAIMVPKILNYDHSLQQVCLSKIGNFPSCLPETGIDFGKEYGSDFYITLYEVAQLLRKTIPCPEVFDQHDYESDYVGTTSIFNFIENDSHHMEKIPYLKGLNERVRKMVLETQDVIKNLPLYPSRRDPNPDNYLITRREGQVLVNLMDWKTFGLARRGYEEGLFMLYLSLDIEKQNDYIMFIENNLNKTELIYFWRTVAVRALHEILSIFHGHYDVKITSVGKEVDDVQQKRNQLAEVFLELVKKALGEINTIIKQNESKTSPKK